MPSGQPALNSSSRSTLFVTILASPSLSYRLPRRRSTTILAADVDSPVLLFRPEPLIRTSSTPDDKGHWRSSWNPGGLLDRSRFKDGKLYSRSQLREPRLAQCLTSLSSQIQSESPRPPALEPPRPCIASAAPIPHLGPVPSGRLPRSFGEVSLKRLFSLHPISAPVPLPWYHSS